MEFQLAGLWLVRLLDGPIHRLDAQQWADEVERWKSGEGTDPRVRAFADAWHQAVPGYAPAPSPGPTCPCPACQQAYPSRRRKRR